MARTAIVHQPLTSVSACSLTWSSSIGPAARRAALLADLIAGDPEVVASRVSDGHARPVICRDGKRGHDGNGVIGKDAHHRRDVVEVREMARAALDRAEPVRRGRADGRVAASVVALEQVDVGPDAGEPGRELRVRVAVPGRVGGRPEVSGPGVVEDVPPVLRHGGVAARPRVALGVERPEREGHIDATRNKRPIDRSSPSDSAGDQTARRRSTNESSVSVGPARCGPERAGSRAVADTTTDRASRLRWP